MFPNDDGSGEALNLGTHDFCLGKFDWFEIFPYSAFYVVSLWYTY